MISNFQLNELAKQLKTNTATVLREYLQVLFLSKLYANVSEGIFFKGGTAVHLIYGSERFSEDLDFTVTIKEEKFSVVINKLFDLLKKEGDINFKIGDSLLGKRFLMTTRLTGVNFATFINLDFSFREQTLQPEKSIITTPYPIFFNSYVFHMGIEEIISEKIRAVLTREKGRDIYDLWYLIARGGNLNRKFILEKLKYYGLNEKDLEKVVVRIESFSEKDFVDDLRPFVKLGDRERLPQIFNYLRGFLREKLTT